ncbi:MAG: response regulator [Chitinophagaceae bacterium]|nr:MAG: response regulator [Chitinophagaceae bacterium]
MTQSLPPKSLFLYADDDLDDRQLMADILADYAPVIELITFPNGTRLLEYILALQPLQPQPALIILDQNMPILDGLSTLRRLRALPMFEEVPMVLFSTSTQPHEAAKAGHLGAGFVTKPLNSYQVQLVLDQLLEYCADDLKEKVKLLRGK